MAATLSAQRWGPERWHLFNYWAHPTRDAGGNPCVIYRHGGGGWTGVYSAFNASTDTFTSHLLSADRDTHFDVVSIQTAQQFIDPSVIVRSSRHNMIDAIFDHKRGVAAIKAWGAGALGQTTYKIDPNKIVTYGYSYGGTVSMLSMITPPITYQSGWKVGARRIYEAQQFDSTTNGVLILSSQVDFRKRLLSNGGAPSLLDYIAYSAVGGIFGTQKTDGGTEWDLVPDVFKESVSMMAYIENGHIEHYRPLFTLYSGATFDGTYPLTSNHDSRMRLDLNSALDEARLSYQTGLIDTSDQDVQTLDSENIIKIYSWMAGLVRNATMPNPNLP